MSARVERIWVCTCGETKTRKGGEKAKEGPICACGIQMKKSKRPAKRTYTESKPDNSIKPQATKEKDRSKLHEALKTEQSTGNWSQLLGNFKSYSDYRKPKGDYRKWWKKVFEDQDYPKNQTNVMIGLKIEYFLVRRTMTEEKREPSERFLKNYVASQTMDKTKMSPTLVDIIVAKERAEESKLRREEEKLVKNSINLSRE